MKRESPIFRSKLNGFTRNASKCLRRVGMFVSLLNETMVMNKVEFCEIAGVSLVILVIPQTVILANRR